MTRPSSRRVLAVALLVGGSWGGSSGAFAQEAPPAAASAASAATSASAPEAPAVASESVEIPLHGGGLFGGDQMMTAEVFRPAGPGPFPVVVYSHGRAPDASARRSLKRGISREQLRFWLSRGDAVVAPIRPGYGATGGTDVEASGLRFDRWHECIGNPNFTRVANVAARSVDATLAWLHAQPWADATHVLLVGQSVGGLTTVAAAAQHPAGVVGYINFAGGAGGNPELRPGRGCLPEQLTSLYTDLGRATTVPNLWIYAENDEYWGPDAPVAWHAAFAQGGSPSTFVHAPPVDGGKGHGLSGRPRRLWEPYVDAFLATVPFGPADTAARPAGPSR